jgi:hypothetical protein
MADTKITALTSISVIDPVNDVLPIVDTSDTGMAITGTTKKITTNQLLGAGGNASFGTLATSGASTLGAAVTVTTGDISASNGSLKSNGASAGVQITSSTGNMYQSVASRTNGTAVTSITVVFTVSGTASSIIVDSQLIGYDAFADFCLGKYSNTTTQVIRSNATALITASLTTADTLTYTLTITVGVNLQYPVLAFKVSVGGGAGGGFAFTALPVVTFIT